MTYLGNDSILGDENLDYDQQNLPVHDHRLPVVELVLVSSVQKSKLLLCFNEFQLLSDL